MKILPALAGVALLIAGPVAKAATMEITAAFTPSMSNPEKNTFTNTTPQSGYCAKWPASCENGAFSIALPITTKITHSISQNNAPRDGPYFGLPGAYRKVTVQNQLTGEKQEVEFRVNLISATMRFPSEETKDNWTDSGFLYAPSPCSYARNAMGTGDWYAFAWRVPADNVACYKISTIDRDDPTAFDTMSFGYELKTPNPLTMSAGVYTGQLHLTVGPGGDFDFGDNYQASDSQLTINFTLSVNHELKLTTTAEAQKVTLEPCAQGRTCTEEEGKANWERWMVTRITPQLTGRSNFTLSSSGAFTVYLACEQQSGTNCALKSDNSAQLVPVQTLLTLPDNIVDSTTGSTVSQRPLALGRDLTRNTFTTKSFSENKSGSIDFLVDQRDVDTMLKTQPDTYRGAVTIIFDPQIY